MAKQLVGPLERHMDKAILAVAGILLLGSAAMYLIASPNEIELGGDRVSPGTIDAKLVERAASVREEIRRARSDAEPVEPLKDEFASVLDPFETGELPRSLAGAVRIGPRVPQPDPGSAAPGQRSLVAVAPLGTPKATRGRSTFVFQDANLNEAFSIANWVTVSAVFDVNEQSELQRAEYGAANKDVFYGPPQLQRRAQRLDGTWSDEDWKDIASWPGRKDAAPPAIMLVGEGDEATIDPGSQVSLERFVNRISAPEVQLSLLRPLLPDILNGDGWSFPILTSRRDVVVQDQEFLFPENADADILDRYAVVDGTGIDLGGGQMELSFADLKKQHEAAYQQYMESARRNQNAEDAIKAYNEAQAIAGHLDATAADKSKAARMKAEAEQLQFDMERRLRRTGRPGAVPGLAGGTAAEEAVRPAQPMQQMWVHDAGPGSVESGRTYQYRMRPTILNRLAGEPQKFRDKQHAAVLLIPGPWTEPVEVAIPRDTMFFLTSKDEGKGTVTVEFFKWEEGVWVDSRRFALAIGEKLKGESRCKLPAPDDPSNSYNGLVFFEYDGTIIDIDFERTYRERKTVSSSKTGVKFAAPSGSCAVVFVDGEGRLHERFVATDRANPERKDVASRVWSK